MEEDYRILQIMPTQPETYACFRDRKSGEQGQMIVHAWALVEWNPGTNDPEGGAPITQVLGMVWVKGQPTLLNVEEVGGYQFTSYAQTLAYKLITKER